jgi:hypothetical protein
LGTNEIEPSIKNYNAGLVSDVKRETRPQSTEILEKARAAIASAERASAAARAAAELVNVKFGSFKLEESKSSSQLWWNGYVSFVCILVNLWQQAFPRSMEEKWLKKKKKQEEENVYIKNNALLVKEYYKPCQWI